MKKAIEYLTPDKRDDHLGLAKVFCQNMQTALDPDELTRVRIKNAQDYYGKSCASHDVLDANVVMQQAVMQHLEVPGELQRDMLLNGDFDAETDEELAYGGHFTRLWNTAWTYARRAHFDENQVDSVHLKNGLYRIFPKSIFQSAPKLAQIFIGRLRRTLSQHDLREVMDGLDSVSVLSNQLDGEDTIQILLKRLDGHIDWKLALRLAFMELADTTHGITDEHPQREAIEELKQRALTLSLWSWFSSERAKDTKPRLNLLDKLADHLIQGKRAHERFDLSVYTESTQVGETLCRTAGCAIGEMPHLWPDQVKWTNSYVVSRTSGELCTGLDLAEAFFGLDSFTAVMLFTPQIREESTKDLRRGADLFNPGCGAVFRAHPANATAAEVGASIRAFCLFWRQSGKPWDSRVEP